MRTTFKIALASVLVFTLAAAAPELNAQARRSTTTTSSTSSSSDNKSAATTASRSASSNASTANRSTSTATRSAGTTANRQSTNTSTATRQSSTSNRSTATPSGSTSTQVRRGNNNGNTGNTTGTTSNSQATRNTGTTTNGNNTGTAARRSTGTSNTETSTTRRQTTTGTTRSTTGTATTTETPSRRVTTTRSNSTGTAAGTGTTGTQTTQSGTPVRTVRSNANATSSRGLTSAPEATEAAKTATVRGGVNANRAAAPNVNYSDGRDNVSIRMDKDRNLNRIPPRERDFITYDRLGAFYSHDPHFFGYRVHTLPPRYRRVSYWGRDYYFYNNVYYLRYGDWYVISRPPFGLALDIAIRDAVFASVRFSYYHSVYRTFDIVDRNYRTILEQNREIARNNELLARQNSALALNSARALSAYEIASALGLIQSFANINTEYFYEDGVFYVVNKKNRYEVIVPPAGALVNELPEDYDTIVLNGVEYYKVDDTVYRLVLVDGIPALEVLGQMYGSMATKYNYYY